MRSSIIQLSRRVSKDPLSDPFSDRGDVNKFFSELGSGSLDDVPEDGGCDVEAEAAASREVKLYRFHDGDSSLVATGKLKQDMLDSSVSKVKGLSNILLRFYIDVIFQSQVLKRHQLYY